MRKKRSKRRSKRSFLKILLIVLFLIILLGFVIFKTEIIKIKNLEILLNKIDCATQEQIKQSANLEQKNFFLINKDLIEKKIKEKFICIKNINLSKLFPNKVKLEIFGREPLAILQNYHQATISAIETIATPSSKFKENFLVDSEGVVFSRQSTPTSLPQVFLNQEDISLGKKLGNNLIIVLQILEKLKSLNLNIKTTQILEEFFILFPTESIPKTIFRLNDKINTQIASLQLILQKAKIENEQLEFIDLRFDKPVIKIVPKKK